MTDAQIQVLPHECSSMANTNTGSDPEKGNVKCTRTEYPSLRVQIVFMLKIVSVIK